MNKKHAFTLMELLVVTGIIAILAMLVVAGMGSFQRKAAAATALSNMRQLGTGIMTYATDHGDELPEEGESNPGWDTAGSEENANAWYNAIPRLLGTKTVGEYSTDRAAFYSKRNLLFTPAAQYPADKTSRPYFAVSMNSKLRHGTAKDSPVRRGSIERASKTVILQESGLPGEKAVRGQDRSKYDGQSKSYANRTVARYSGKTMAVFADGHAESLAAENVVSPDGQAYFPQSGPAGGDVYWTIDPDANAND